MALRITLKIRFFINVTKFERIVNHFNDRSVKSNYYNLVMRHTKILAIIEGIINLQV